MSDTHTFRDDLRALTGWGVADFVVDHLAADFNDAVRQGRADVVLELIGLRAAVGALGYVRFSDQPEYVGRPNLDNPLLNRAQVLGLIEAAIDGIEVPA